MSTDALQELVVAFSTGLGLLVVGLAALVVGNCSRLAWGGIVLAVAAVSGLGPLTFNVPELAPIPAAAVVLVVSGLSALGSRRFAAMVASTYSRISGPVGKVALLLVAGAALIAGSLARHTAADEEAIDRDMSFMLLTVSTPSKAVPVDGVEMRTDVGRPVQILAAAAPRPAEELVPAERNLLEQQAFYGRVIQTAPASDICNCHGWVFTGGRYWLGPADVERILAENAYAPVSDPRPNDIAIYRNGPIIAHTAVVRSAVPGRPVLVEGKWGWMGVFVHAVGDSCYGQQCTFYRSPRNGHVLAETANTAQPMQGVMQDADTE